MKNLKKALALFTAVATMSVSVSAFADELSASGDFDQDGVTGAYNIAENTFDVTLESGTAEEGKQMSFLVLDSDTITDDQTNEITTAIEADDILFIDQKEAGADANTFSAVINPARIGDGTAVSIPAGKYPVRVGYYNNLDQFTIATAIVEVTEDEEEGVTVTIAWGDVDVDGLVNTLDATAIVNAYLGGQKVFTTEDESYTFTWNSDVVADKSGNEYTMPLAWGDVDADGLVNTLDATAIVNAYLGGQKAFITEDGNYTYTWGQDAEIQLTPAK